MKPFTKLPAFITLLSFSLSSCEKESIKIDKEDAFNRPFRSSVHEKVALQNEQARMLVEVKNISDQRCPNHVKCSDQGMATVRIELSNMANSRAESLLHLGTMGDEVFVSDSATVKLDNSWYIVTLHSVNPHPIADSEEIQTAELSVKPKP